MRGSEGALTNPEVACLKVHVSDLVSGLQLAEVEPQDVLNLLVMNLSQDSSFLLWGPGDPERHPILQLPPPFPLQTDILSVLLLAAKKNSLMNY